MRMLTVLIVVSMLAAAPAWAQTPRSERPYRGLFAGDTGNAEQLLTLSASFGGGYDDDISANANAAPVGPNAPRSSTYLNGSAQLGYSLAKSTKSFSASFGAGGGHYPGLSEPNVVHYSGSVGGSIQVARHSTFSLTQSETYQPFYLWSWLPTDVAPVEAMPAFDPGTMTITDAVQAASLSTRPPLAADAVSASSAEYYLASDTGVGYTQALAQHLNLELSYGYRRSDSKSGARDYSSQSGSGRLSYNVGKGVALVGGYGYSDTQYSAGNGQVVHYQGHLIDGGVNYNKALSFSRRTTLGFQTGLAGVQDGIQTHYSVVGNAQLTHELGRSWSTGLGYARSVSYVETFRAPVLTDSLSGGIGGLINRATQFHASTGVSRGNVGYTVNNTFDTYFASAGARFAISRKTGLSVYYGYYRYSFENGIVLPPGVSSFTNRQSVGFSFDTWLPLIQRNRSANATR